MPWKSSVDFVGVQDFILIIFNGTNEFYLTKDWKWPLLIPIDIGIEIGIDIGIDIGTVIAFSLA